MLLLQAGEDTYLQLEFWDENIDLMRKSAAIIRKAGREHRVIVGNPQNAKIWQMCGQEMPNASRILPDSEVIPSRRILMEIPFCDWSLSAGTQTAKPSQSSPCHA